MRKNSDSGPLGGLRADVANEPVKPVRRRAQKPVGKEPVVGALHESGSVGRLRHLVGQERPEIVPIARSERAEPEGAADRGHMSCPRRRPSTVAVERIGGKAELPGNKGDDTAWQAGRISNCPPLRPGPGQEQGQAKLVSGTAGRLPPA
ncbi:MAG: hypothetical protein NVSMB32_06530 [Actinomycetota bacterium]